jgi:PAS domain S-box-containing protein
MVLEADNHAIHVNPRWSQLTQRSYEKCIGLGWQDIIFPVDAGWMLEEIQLAREQGRELSMDFRIKSPGKEDASMMVHGRMSEFQTPNGERIGYLLTLEDTSDRSRMEGELRSAVERAEEASESKSQFLANMSHEIRTPMNGILGIAALLEDLELDTQAREYVQTVIGSGESLLAILNDILDFSRTETGKLESPTQSNSPTKGTLRFARRSIRNPMTNL